MWVGDWLLLTESRSTPTNADLPKHRNEGTKTPVNLLRAKRLLGSEYSFADLKVKRKEALFGIDATGYEVVLTVHDEVICEAPDTSDCSPEHLVSLLAANPPWAPDMQLAAAGFETDRYKKD